MDKPFLDTNVLVYLAGQDARKQQQITYLLRTLPRATISAQCITEFVNVCLRKHLLSTDQIPVLVERFLYDFNLVALDDTVLRRALHIHHQHQTSW